MPKKSAPHRDGWIWELFRDMVGRFSTAGLLRKFVPETIVEVHVLCNYDPVSQIGTNGTHAPRRPEAPTHNNRGTAHALLSPRRSPNEKEGHRREPVEIKPVFIRYLKRGSSSDHGLHRCLTLQLEECQHRLLTRPHIARVGGGRLLPLPHADLHMHVWGHMHTAVTLRQRPKPTSYKHVLVRGRTSPRRDGI